MSTVNVVESGSQLSKLIELAERGEGITIVREGKPVARLTGIKREKKPVRFGALKGKVWIGDDFDAPLAEDFLIVPEA